MKINLFDSHVHSDNSPDGSHAVIYLCEQAIRQRIMGLAITDHFECDTDDLPGNETRIRQSGFEVERARHSFGSAIKLCKGIEVGQANRHPQIAKNILASADFDFVLGSMHTGTDGTDYYYVDYDDPKIVVADILKDYYDNLVQLAHWNGFDSMAHLRYPERYIWGNHRIPVNITPYMGQIEEILKILIQNGKALELNTSAMRKGLDEFDPGVGILRRYKELGGELITLGSDAHVAKDMTSGFDTAMDALLAIGFRYFAFYQNRKPVMLKIL